MSRAWLLCHDYVRNAKFPYCTINLEVISQTGRGMEETGSICHSVFQAKSNSELFALAAGKRVLTFRSYCRTGATGLSEMPVASVYNILCKMSVEFIKLTVNNFNSLNQCSTGNIYFSLSQQKLRIRDSSNSKSMQP